MNISNNPNFIKWFGNSVVRNEDGTPKVCYHTSKKGGFTEFEIAEEDIGIHFGTLDQAISRAGFSEDQLKETYKEYLETFEPSEDEGTMDYDTFIESPECLEMVNHFRSSKGQSIYPVYLRLCKPIYIRDLGNWKDEYKIAKEIIAANQVGSALISDLRNWLETGNFDQDYNDDDYNEEQGLNQLRELLQSYGHEGLVYKNEYEAKSTGELSYCVFHSGQIKSALSNKGTYNLYSQNITEKNINESYSEFILPEIDPNLQDSPLVQRAIKFYGLTDNPYDAFYITPDGQMLDSSGRNQGSSSGGRNIDHRNVSHLIKKQDSSWTRQMYHFMMRSGCIRMDVRSQFITSVNVPNRYQRATIAQIFEHHIQIDLLNKKFDHVLQSELPYVSKQSLEDFYNKYAEEFSKFDKDYEAVEELENRMMRLL
jgi:hypothetical protein